MDVLKFMKVRDVKSPCRAHWSDAGIDFFIPNDTGAITVRSHERICIPSGIKVQIPFGYALIAFNKSGIATKLGLGKMAEVIDYQYQGEIHISLINTTTEYIILHSGDCIIQFILVSIGLHTPVEMTEEFMYSNISKRGTGNFGSTGGVK